MSIFDSVPLRRPQRSSFDLSHEVKTSTNFGQLTPILCREVLPGDTWSVNSEVMLRFAPLISPVMHRINVTVHFFFVPNRLLWDKWEDFITGGKDGLQAPLFPTFNPTALKASAGATNVVHVGSPMDYFGFSVPKGNDSISDMYPNNADNLFNCLPFKAYTKIYNDYYRDQNLQDEVDIHADVDGDNSLYWQNFIIRYRAYEKDYFTSSLPWTQRGGDVQVPMDGVGTVYYDDAITGQGIFRAENGQPFPPDRYITSDLAGGLVGEHDGTRLSGFMIQMVRFLSIFPRLSLLRLFANQHVSKSFLKKMPVLVLVTQSNCWLTLACVLLMLVSNVPSTSVAGNRMLLSRKFFKLLLQMRHLHKLICLATPFLLVIVTGLVGSLKNTDGLLELCQFCRKHPISKEFQGNL